MTKKKLLIDLMLENNVRWPDGAEFAAQDNLNERNHKLSFYKSKPQRSCGAKEWGLDGYISHSRVDLPELCRNWHQTIVTREQYEVAQEMRDDAGRNSEDAKSSKCIGEFHIDVKLSDIIDQISHHQAESQRHEEAMIDHNDKELALRDQLNEMLAKVGMNVVDVERDVVSDNGGWPDYCDESGIIVDWNSVPEGAEAECIEREGCYEYHVGNVYKFGFDDFGDFGPIDHDEQAPSKLCRSRYKFRLIK